MREYGDENGLFWQEGDLDARSGSFLPESDWRPPDAFPDRLYGTIGIDLETCDLGLASGQGPGWAWEGGGFVAGYAIAADNFTAYLPIAHKGAGNLDPGKVRRWLNHVLADETQPKVGANVMYDLGWAERDGVTVRGPVYDVQWAEALLDEHRFSYALDAIAKDRLGRRKEEGILRQAASVYKVNPKAELWKLPPQYVGYYAEEDAALARDMLQAQIPLLQADDLMEVFNLEHDLMPQYLDMRRRGVRVNLDRAEQLKAELDQLVENNIQEIHRRTGVRINLWAAYSIAQAFDKEGLAYPRTAKTQAPSITKALLNELQEHWLAQMIRDSREASKLADTFVAGHILGHHKKGRIHGEIHPLRGESGGTVTGRLSMSSPNLQNIPARTDMGKKIRSVFLPEEGQLWWKPDFSQQEPRLLVHFAASSCREEDVRPALELYQNPDGDIYQFLQDFAGLTRGASKTLTLARIYGRGVDSTAKELRISVEETRSLFQKFDDALPIAKIMSDKAMGQVERLGYVRSLTGRRMRFPFYEPRSWQQRDGRELPLEQAKEAWGLTERQLTRSRAHKALNSAIQSSAADQTKRAMRAILWAGLGKHLLVQVHDELDLSADDPAIAEQIRQCMIESTRLRVPTRADLEVGENWGELSPA